MLRRTWWLKASTAKQELQKAVPLLQKHFPSYSGLSIGALAAVTTHIPLAAPADLHTAQCPVQSRRVPITAILDEADPCPLCVKRRVNHLANEAFCNDFEKRCRLDAASSVPRDMPSQLEGEIVKSFKTVSAFLAEVTLFVKSSMSPGRVWVVHDGEKIRVVTMPLNQLPLAHGLWPLFVVKATEECLCVALDALIATEKKKKASAAAECPAWSRAARNPAVQQAATARSTTPTQPPLLSAARAHIAQQAIALANWSFVLEQMQKAVTYYASSERRTARTSYHVHLEEQAAALAMSSLRDTDGSASTGAAAKMPYRIVNRTVSAEQGVAAEKEKQEEEEEETTPPSASSGGSNNNLAAASSVKTEAKQADHPAASLDDPQVRQGADGSWEYHYKSGDVTIMHADGTKVFRTEGLTTTVRPDGSTLFEYANKSSIMDYADGRRVTTYPDGSTKEEQR